MKKKIIVIISMLVIAFNLSACGTTQDKDKASDSNIIETEADKEVPDTPKKEETGKREDEHYKDEVTDDTSNDTNEDIFAGYKLIEVDGGDLYGQ